MLRRQNTWYAASFLVLALTLTLPVLADRSVRNGVVSSGNFRLAYPSAKWQMRKTEGNAFEFTHVNKVIYARFIHGSRGTSTDKLVEAALESFRKADANLQTIGRDTKTIDGVEVVSLRVAVSSKGVPLIYWGYYHSGDAGAVQVLTYTGRASFEKHEADMGEFLDGLRIGQ